MSRKSVLVNIPKLQAARLAKGYASARQLDAKLHSLGHEFAYRAVEYRKKKDKEKHICLDHAVIISKFLEVPFDEVFKTEPTPDKKLENDNVWEPSMIYMTLDDLQRLSLLRKDIAQQKNALLKIRGNTPRTREIRTAIKADLQYKFEQAECECARVKRYVDEIDDVFIRKIIKLRFLDSLPWYLVAAQCYADKDNIQRKAFAYIHYRSGLCIR